MAEDHRATVLRRFYLAYGVVALALYIVLMVVVFPWWDAKPHRFTLTIGVAPDQPVLLAFAADADPVPLLPAGEPGDTSLQRTVELPARAYYHLQLVFPEGTQGEALVKDFELAGMAPGDPSTSLDPGDLVEPGDGSVRLHTTADGVRIQAAAGGHLRLPMTYPGMTVYQWLVTATKLTLVYLIVALINLLLLVNVLRFPDGIQAYRRRTPPAEIVLLVILVAAGALIHLYLVRFSMPVFTPGTSDTLIVNSAGPASAPGYPWMLARLAPLHQWDMGQVAIGQALIFCVAVLLLALSLSRMVQAYLLGPFVLLVLVAPPAVWASRHIGTESLLASAWMAALAAFLFLWQREGVVRWLGFVVFACAGGAAVAVSATGWLLVSLPLAMLIGAFWWSLAIRGAEFWKIPVFWRTLGQVALPVAAMGVAMLAASSWASSRQPETGAPGQAPAAASVGDSAQRHLRIIQWARLSGYGLFLPPSAPRDLPYTVVAYDVATRYDNPAHAQAVQDSIRDVMRATQLPVHVPERRSNSRIFLYNTTVVPVYAWLYRPLLLAALAGWLVGVVERKYLAGLLAMPFLLNIPLQVYGLGLHNATIQSLDACLWLAAVCGLVCLNPKAMQKPVDDADRRCLPPIRPKRLLTRFRRQTSPAARM